MNQEMMDERTAIRIWEDNVGDSGKAPTNLELLTFANAVLKAASEAQ